MRVFSIFFFIVFYKKRTIYLKKAFKTIPTGSMKKGLGGLAVGEGKSKAPEPWSGGNRVSA